MLKVTTAVAILLAIVGTGAGHVRQAEAQQAPGITAPSAAPRCPDARTGIVFYRSRYAYHRSVRGLGTPYPAGRKPRNCADAHYLADVWDGRAWDERQQTEQYLKERARENEHPKWIALRLLNNDREEWGCLMYITSVENARMDPTLDFGGGHGNVYEAYGIPQANPGTKMASAGPDWRTNPETQLRWMIGYARARFGSMCGAAYHRRTSGWY